MKTTTKPKPRSPRPTKPRQKSDGILSSDREFERALLALLRKLERAGVIWMPI